MKPAYQHGCILSLYTQIWNYFIFVFSTVGKFQKYKLKWKTTEWYFIAGCIFILNQQH